MICKNCSKEFEGNFCNSCGQKKVEGRFTVKEFVHNFIHSFTHLDSGILFLIKELFFRPGIVAQEYIQGKRKKYFNPLQFLILVIAASTFLAINYKLFGPNINPDTIPGLTERERFFLLFNAFIYRHFNLILFLSVPIISVYSRLIFRSSGYNFAENLIFNTFISGERTLFYILLTPLLYFNKQQWYIAIGIYYIGWIIYFGYAYVQFFKGNKVHTVFKYIAVLILLILTSQGLSMTVFTLFFYK